MKTSLGIAKDAADAAKRSADFAAGAQRAWVVPRNMMFEEAPAKDQKLKFKLLYDNPGTTPAIDEFNQAVPMLLDRSVVDITPEKKYISDAIQKHVRDACRKIEPSRAGRVVYPGTSPDHSYEFHMTYPAALVTDEFIDGKQVLLVFGCLKYRSLGKVHESAYCFVGHAGLKVKEGFSICPYGNHAN